MGGPPPHPHHFLPRRGGGEGKGEAGGRGSLGGGFRFRVGGVPPRSGDAGLALCVSRAGMPPKPAPSLGPPPNRLGLCLLLPTPVAPPPPLPRSLSISPHPHSMYPDGALLLYWATIRFRPSRPRRTEFEVQLPSAPAWPPELQSLCLQPAVSRATCVPTCAPKFGGMLCSGPQFVHLKNVDSWPSLQCWCGGYQGKTSGVGVHLGSMSASTHSLIHSIHPLLPQTIPYIIQSLIHLFIHTHSLIYTSPPTPNPWAAWEVRQGPIAHHRRMSGATGLWVGTAPRSLGGSFHLTEPT